MLILKENAANSVPTPPVGKDTFFIDDSGTPSIKNSAGNVTTFPVVNASNAQVVFMNGSSLSGEAALTYDFNNNVLNVTGNIAAGNVKTDNLLYANGSPWDLSDPGGSNTQIQFNDDESFGGSAAFTFNKSSNAVSMTGNLTVDNVGGANLVSANYLTGTLTTAAQPNVTSLGTLTNLSVSGNALISGNLTVDGNLVYVNVETVAVEDPIIQLQTGPNGAAPSSNSGKDVGTALNYFDTAARVAFMGWDVSNAEFAFGSQTSITNEVVTFSTLGNARAQTFKGNVEAAGTSNIAAVNLAGHIIPTVDDTYDLGNSTNRFRDLWVSGNSIRIGNSRITSNATSLVLQNPDGGQVVVSGNSISSTTSLVNGNSNVNIPSANGNVNISVTGTANVVVVTSTGANINGTLNATGNANVGNIGATNGVFTNVSGNGSSLSSITGANVTGAVAFATTANAVAGANVSGEVGFAAVANSVAGANVSGQVGNALVAGTVYTNAQPNITSVGTLSSVSVTGNANVGNLGTAGLISATGNVSGGNITTAGQLVSSISTGTAPLVVTSTTVVANLRAATSNVANTVNDAAQPNITSVGTLTSLAVTGNATAGNVYANSGTVGASLLAGTLTTAAQPNITSIGTLTSLSVTGNGNLGNVGATAGVFTGNISSLNANLGNLVTANIANLVDLNVSGNANIGGGSGGNISGANVITANTFVGNLQGQVANGNSNVSIPAANGNVNISAVGTANVLVVTGTGVNVAGTLNATGNANVGNLGATNGVFTNVSGNGSALSSITGANVTGQVGNALVSGTVYTNAQPNITSVGTLTGLGVNGTVTAVAFTANTGVFTGNGSGLSAIAGANVTGQVGNALVAGTVYTNAQPNITSVGTLSSLSVTGNVAAGNLTTTGILSVTGTGTSSIAGNLDMTSNNITNLAAPVASTDAATKQYVDDIAQGLHVHAPSAAATPDTLANISGGTVTYNNGSSGVGATLTTTGTYTTIDTVNIASVGTRILVKNEANAAHNGIYTYTSGTVLTRATDFDTPTEMAGGDFTFVSGGATYNDTGWVMTDPVTTVGTSNVTFVQFSGAGTYTAGTGLTLTGSVFSVNASQTQVTSVGTLTGLNVNGTVTASAFTANTGIFTGNGAGLSQLAGGNVTGQVANALVAGTVYTAAQPNITSVGTLSSLSVSGNANVGNIGAAAGVFTTVSGNGAALTDLNASNISSGTLAQARLANSSLTVNGVSISLGGSGTVTATATNTLTLGSYLTGTSYNGSAAVTAAVDATTTNTASKVVARDASGNFSAGTITATLSGAATTAGTVTTAAQPNITSVGTLTGLTLANASTISVGSNTNVGTFTGNFSLSAGSRLNATYADLAEKYVADAEYDPGTVLIFGGGYEVTVSNEFDSHRVAGVVSTNPAYTMNSACEGEHVVDLALQGRVPVKVHGPVAKGDLMVSGPNGHAVANNMARAGTIIGKALENFSGGHGVIEVVVGRF